jgi:hypothetical protein
MKLRPDVAVALGVALMALAAVGAPHAAQAATEFTWHSIDSGSGTASGGGFTLTGSIGQPDVGQPLTGGTFSLLGGFFAAPVETFAIAVPAVAGLSLLALAAALLGVGFVRSRHARVRR